MNLSWRDTATTLLAAAGAVEVFAKLQNYSWWLIGSWKGAVAVLGVMGLAMLFVNADDLTRWRSWVTWIEAGFWLGAATLIVIGLFAASHAMFYAAAIVLGAIWLGAFARHSYHTTHHTPMPYATAH